MMSTLQAAQAYDVPTPFAILDKYPNNPDLEPRSSYRISSEYSLDDLYDESDPGLGENTPPDCTSPTEEVESKEEDGIREIDPVTREQLLRLGEIMDRDKEDLMDIALNARPQQVVEDESSSDSEMEHPLDYKEEFKFYVDSDDDSDDDLVIPTIRPSLKLKPAIVKKQSPKRKPIKNKFWDQLQDFKQKHVSQPNQYHTYETIDYYVATPSKTTKFCSICKQEANPIQHMQAVTWWGDKRKYFDMIDVPAIDACSTCFDTWVGHHKDSAKKGFLECTNGKTHILRAPEVKDFFGSFKSQSLYVKVRN